jgi:hypothetical protein
LEGVTEGPWEFDGGVVWRIAVRAVPDPRDETGQTPMPEHSQEKVCDTNPETAEFIAAARSLVPELVAEVERLHSWDGLMSLLDTYYPEDIFPTQPDDTDRDPGPRIVSLIRYLDAARAENEQLWEEIGDRDEANEIIRNALKRLRTEKGVSE